MTDSESPEVRAASAVDGSVPATTPSQSEEAPGALPVKQMPSSQPVFVRALWWGLASMVALLIICGGVGWLVSQGPGLVGGVLGAGFAGVFMGLTVGSIAFANRLINSDFYVIVFFAIVVGGWLVKFVAFIVAAVTLRDQPWLDPKVLFFSLLASVLVSLVIDVIIMTRSRLPYVSDAG